MTESAVDEALTPRSRLVIHKLALINFKSYAGRQEIGPFHKSFSAIVGPNGSGKSNTIDALLFVFGYRASKMRQAKLAELIHNSARFPSLDECSVEIHFQEIIDHAGPDDYEVVPGSELVVARVAYKNSTSKYLINGRTTNKEEVTRLLKGKGIDLDHNRFLILQGEVESIALMKPKAPTEHEDGLLEYLEDIIGTSQYKTRIDEALVELDKFAEERAEKLSRLKIVEREKSSLEEQKREAENYLRLQNDLVRAQSRLYQWYLWQAMEQEEVTAKLIDKTVADLELETERNKDNIAECEDLEAHYNERVKIYEDVKKHSAAVLKNLAVHEKQEVSLEEKKKHATGKVKKLRKAIQDDTHAKKEAQHAIGYNSEKMEKEKTKIDEYEASLEKEEKELEKIIDSLKDKTQVFHDQIEAKQKELAPWTTKINTKQAEADIATSERDMLAQKADGVKKTAEEADETLAQLKDDRKAKEDELKAMQTERATVQKDLKAAEKKLNDTQALVQDLRAKASQSRQKVEEAKASQSANHTQNAVLDYLTRLKNSGRISGFHGRLGSLGTIPDKYDAAISTACGTLNHLVVDKVEQAQACIEYLRKQNIGRASFMILEKMPAYDLAPIETPENVPRLFDLIKPSEERFVPAFYKGVANTLVTDDLEQANRIAFSSKKRWRVVTLAGQLIDSSGTMSGGGTKVAKGGMSSRFAAADATPEVLRRYEKDSDEAARQLEASLAELKQLELDVDALGKRVPSMDVAYQKAELDIANCTKRIAEAERRVQELKSQSKPDAGDLKRIGVLDREIAASTKELEKLRGNTSAIEKDIQALEKKIIDIGGSRLLTQKSKVDGIKLHMNLATEEVTKAEVGKAKAEKDSVKYENSIATSQNALQEVEGELEGLDEQLKQCGKVLADIRSKVEEAQHAADNTKEDLDGIKADLDKKMVVIRKFREREMELQQKLEDAKLEAAETGKKITQYRKAHDNLKLEEIDDEEDEVAEHAPPKPGGETGKDGAEPTDGAADPEAADGTADPETADKDAAPDVKPEPPKRAEKAQAFELPVFTKEELATYTKNKLVADVSLVEEQMKALKPNMGVLKEYRKREAEFLKRAKDLEDVTARRDEQKKCYDDLRKNRLDEFMAGFNTISSKLKEMYQLITRGGNAELELVDSMDPFAEGIIFSVMPPKKSWKNISNLSGGEKTLSSLALVFALHVYKPTPLYFMDEIDAALDFRNVSIIANYIKDRTKNAQFIIISLRNDMFELSQRLIGIYKTNNATQSIAIDNKSLSAVPVRV